MLKSSYHSLVKLILSSVIAVNIITMSHPRSHASTEQSRQESCDIRDIGQDLRGRQQQQQWEDEMNDKSYIEVTESMEFVVSALKIVLGPHHYPPESEHVRSPARSRPLGRGVDCASSVRAIDTHPIHAP